MWDIVTNTLSRPDPNIILAMIPLYDPTQDIHESKVYSQLTYTIIKVLNLTQILKTNSDRKGLFKSHKESNFLNE